MPLSILSRSSPDIDVIESHGYSNIRMYMEVRLSVIKTQKIIKNMNNVTC